MSTATAVTLWAGGEPDHIHAMDLHFIDWGRAQIKLRWLEHKSDRPSASPVVGSQVRSTNKTLQTGIGLELGTQNDDVLVLYAKLPLERYNGALIPN